MAWLLVAWPVAIDGENKRRDDEDTAEARCGGDTDRRDTVTIVVVTARAYTHTRHQSSDAIKSHFNVQGGRMLGITNSR